MWFDDDDEVRKAWGWTPEGDKELGQILNQPTNYIAELAIIAVLTVLFALLVFV